MPYRLLAIVTVLAAGDYLLWNWSLAGSHDTMALLSGLTLPLLAIAFVRLLLGSLINLIARSARQPRVQSFGERDGSQLSAPQTPVDAASVSPPSGKLAA